MFNPAKTPLASGRTWAPSITISRRYSLPLISDRTDPCKRASGSFAWDTSAPLRLQSKKHEPVNRAEYNFTSLKVYMIEEDPIALDHPEVHIVEPYF